MEKQQIGTIYSVSALFFFGGLLLSILPAMPGKKRKVISSFVIGFVLLALAIGLGFFED